MRPNPLIFSFALVFLFGFASTHWREEERDDDLDEDVNDEDTKAFELYKRLKERLERLEDMEEKEEIDAVEFLKQHNKTGSIFAHNLQILSWNYQTNETAFNAAKKNKYGVKQQQWSLQQAFKAQGLKTEGLNAKQRRRMKIIATTAYLKTKKDRKKLAFTKSYIAGIYGKAQVVLKSGRRLVPGETGIIRYFRKTRDYDLLAEAWKKWRDATGNKYKSDYVKMIQLLNKGAKQNGYKDYGYYEWFTDFENPNFNKKVVDLFHKIKPLYKELHAYVRYKLSKEYPGRFNPRGAIPAHLLGNVWGQQMQNIFHLIKPYKDAKSTDITSVMKTQKWTVHRMFKTAEEFFTSIGLYAMTPKFWARSMFKKPPHRPVECHASAWDFSTQDDFRIKMCTEVNQNNFKTIHHEMGHIEYYMSYRKQPESFRNGANSGFHEAIGDTIALSVTNDNHYRKMGFIKSHQKSSEKAEINALMDMALRKIAFIPYGLLVDSWRWRVFNGTIKPKDYNKGWWKLRYELQGLIPPVKRSDSDFDAGAKYHVAANVPYIRYFTSFIMQFQFYEAMCKKSGHDGPLHQCDFYRSRKAGHLLKSVLKLGNSRPWPEAMEKMTGQREIRLDSLNKYFDPLRKWLMEYRKQKDYPIGW